MAAHHQPIREQALERLQGFEQVRERVVRVAHASLGNGLFPRTHAHRADAATFCLVSAVLDDKGLPVRLHPAMERTVASALRVPTIVLHLASAPAAWKLRRCVRHLRAGIPPAGFFLSEQHADPPLAGPAASKFAVAFAHPRRGGAAAAPHAIAAWFPPDRVGLPTRDGGFVDYEVGDLAALVEWDASQAREHCDDRDSCGHGNDNDTVCGTREDEVPLRGGLGIC